MSLITEEFNSYIKKGIIEIDITTGKIYRVFKSGKRIEKKSINGYIRLSVNKVTKKYKVEDIVLNARFDNDITLFTKLHKRLLLGEKVFVYYVDGNKDNHHTYNTKYCNQFEYFYYTNRDEINFNKYIAGRVSIIDENYSPKKATIMGLIPYGKIPGTENYIDAYGNVFHNGKINNTFISKDGFVRTIITVREFTIGKLIEGYQIYPFKDSTKVAKIVTLLGKTFLKPKKDEVTTTIINVKNNVCNLLFVVTVKRSAFVKKYHNEKKEEFLEVMNKANLPSRKIIVDNVEYDSLTDAAVYIISKGYTTVTVKAVIAYLCNRLNSIKNNDTIKAYKKKITIKRID